MSYSQNVMAGNFFNRNANPVFQPPYNKGGFVFNTYAPAPAIAPLPSYQQSVQEFLKNPLKFVQPIYNPPANLTPVNTPSGGTGLLRPAFEDPASKAIQLTGDLKMENTVNVTLASKEDKALGQQLENTILDSLDSVFKVVERNLK